MFALTILGLIILVLGLEWADGAPLTIKERNGR